MKRILIGQECLCNPVGVFYPRVISKLLLIQNGLNVEIHVLNSKVCPEQNKKIFMSEGLDIKYINLEERTIDESFLSAYDVFITGKLVDMKLAENTDVMALLFDAGKVYSGVGITSDSWDGMYSIIRDTMRQVSLERKTSETLVNISFNPDGSGISDIETGIGFFDHMLDQISRHSGCDLKIRVKGDLQVDEHHSIEDAGLLLGEAVAKSLGDKKGLERYGFCLPMDDCQAQVAIDFGGRPWFIWEAEFSREKIGDMPTEMFDHFFKAFSDTAKCNLHIKATGKNEHHKIESIFKAFARSLRMALRRNVGSMEVPSTKGKL